MGFPEFNLVNFLLMMAAVIICISIHEFAHALAAYRAGDLTPKLQGRISINPIDHMDPVGTVMIVVTSLSGVGFGWGKPVQVNPANFDSPRWDNLRVSLWGPLSNIITAVVVGLGLRFFISDIPMALLQFVSSIVLVSLALAFFNMIPVGPLDGQKILSALLPTDTARNFDMFMARYGMILLLALVILVLPNILGPPIWHTFTLITGFV